MTAPLRRTTTTRDAPMPWLSLPHICDQCGRHRAHGNHNACARKRQSIHASKWKGRT